VQVLETRGAAGDGSESEPALQLTMSANQVTQVSRAGLRDAG
jgi:hypothetical protein